MKCDSIDLLNSLFFHKDLPSIRTGLDFDITYSFFGTDSASDVVTLLVEGYPSSICQGGASETYEKVQHNQYVLINFVVTKMITTSNTRTADPTRSFSFPVGVYWSSTANAIGALTQYSLPDVCDNSCFGEDDEFDEAFANMQLGGGCVGVGGGGGGGTGLGVNNVSNIVPRPIWYVQDPRKGEIPALCQPMKFQTSSFVEKAYQKWIDTGHQPLFQKVSYLTTNVDNKFYQYIVDFRDNSQINDASQINNASLQYRKLVRRVPQTGRV